MNHSLTLHEKIGQMVMTGFSGPEFGQSIREAVEKGAVGNIVLFAGNIRNARQMHRLCTEIQQFIRQKTGVSPFIAIDQEGGMVSRMPFDGTIFPGNMAVAATGSPRNARIAGRITGRELHALGCSIDFAPVMDINTNPNNIEIGVRSYGDQPETVQKYGLAMAEGLQEEGVLAVAKHFPGHGSTSVDSHFGLPRVDKTSAQMEAGDLVPFRAAAEGRVGGVMSAHILFPAMEKKNVPATLSHTILTGLLRQRMKFQGLIFTDCLEMGAIKRYYGTAEGAVAAVEAGADMVLISHTPSAAAEVAQNIEAAVRDGRIPEETIDRAVERILKFKEQYAEYEIAETDLSVVGCREDRSEARRISAEGITPVRSGAWKLPEGSHPLFIGCKADRATPVSDEIAETFNFPSYLAEKTGGTGLLIPLNPSEEEIPPILEKAAGFDPVVVGLYNGHINRGQIALANRLCEGHRRILAVSLRGPYDIPLLDSRIPALAAYEYTPLSFDTLADVFRGAAVPSGRLTVRL